MGQTHKYKQDVVFGLDIGTTKVVAVAGRKNDYDQVEVLAVSTVESTGVLRGMVSNIDKTVEAINKAMAHIERKVGQKAKEVVVGIAGQHIKSVQHNGVLTRENSDTEINETDIRKIKNDMHKIVLGPGDKILHVIPQDYTVDNESGIIDPKGMSGVRLEANFHLITCQHNAFKKIIRCVEKAGMEVTDIILEPIASAKSVLSEQEMEAGVAIVDIGGGTTDLTVIHENIIRHTGVIPFGGSVITRDIKEGCIVMNDQAEKLKTSYGSALADKLIGNQIITIPGIRGREAKEVSQRNLAHIIQARMEEIFDHIYFELTKSGYHTKLIAGVVLTGGGAQLKNIRDLASFHLGMSAKIGEPGEKLAHGYPKVLASPVYSTSIGLLIHAIQENEKRVEAPKTGVNEDSNQPGKGGNESEKDGSKPENNFWSKFVKKASDVLSPQVDRDF